MPDLTILQELIKNTATVPLCDKYGRKYVTLTEPQNPTCSITINGIPDNAIVIKADAFKSPDSVFNGSRGECKRGDYVIIANTGTKKIILCIEMKTTKGKESEIIQQLKGSLCFVAYCSQIGENFWDCKQHLKTYEYRFISISHISLAKKPTRIKPKSGIHNSPEKMLKISCPHYLEFNHLAGRN